MAQYTVLWSLSLPRAEQMRQLVQALQGTRASAFSEWSRSAGLLQIQVQFVAFVGREVAFVHLDMVDASQAWKQVLSSQDSFAFWLREHLAEVLGIDSLHDISEPQGEREEVFFWSSQ